MGPMDQNKPDSANMRPQLVMYPVLPAGRSSDTWIQNGRLKLRFIGPS